MSNGTSAQIQFNFQRPFDGIYRVGAGQFFTTIQSAITQAVADGHTSNDNPAYIEIYPGTYTENLSLSPGVHLIGQGTKTVNIPAATGVGTEIKVVGNMTYANSNALNRTQNRLILRGITFTVVNGIVFVISGTAPVQVNVYECTFQKQTGGDVNPTFQFTNTQATSQCRFNDTIHDMNVAATIVLDLQRGTTDFRGRLSGIISSAAVTMTTLASLANAAVLNLANEQGMGPVSVTQMFAITSATAVINIDRANLQNSLVGGIVVNFTANGNVRIRQSAVFMQDATSKIASGTTGVLVMVNNSYAVNLTTFADAGVNVQMATGQAQFDRTTKSLYVGGGSGNFTTIAAALTQAAAINAAVAGRCRIYISPGTYTENLTLQDNVDLIANDQAASNNGFGQPVNIVGHHTWAATAANALVQIRGIGFNVQVSQGASPLFAFSGAATRPQLVLLECNIFYVFASASGIFVVTASSNPIVMCTRTAIAFNTDVAGAAIFDLTGSTDCQVWGIECLDGFEGGFNVSGFTSQAATSANIVKTGTNSQVEFRHTQLGGFGDNGFIIADAGSAIYFNNCTIVVFGNALGTLITFSAAGSAFIRNCLLQYSGGTYLAAGAAGTFQYGACAFPTVSDVQLTLTIVLDASVVTPIA